MIDFLRRLFSQNSQKPAIVFENETFSYGWLEAEISKCINLINASKIPAGSVIAIIGDFNPTSTSMLLALIETRMICVPLSKAAQSRFENFFTVAEVEFSVDLTKDQFAFHPTPFKTAKHPIYSELKKKMRPGLVLFSSGSTGQPKASVHDFSLLLDKFRTSKQSKTIMSFLLFDHIGGINTLLYGLSNTAKIVTVSSRSPHEVAGAIQNHRVQILPTSPSFCNLLLVHDVLNQYNLSSLELVTYGTEVMPLSTLEKLNEKLPNVKFQQTYGLSEIGIMRSKSESNDSLWVKIGGDGFETRVVEGLLEVKAKSAMIGYLNAPSPFTSDGWFRTGDAVEVKGEFFKILGRKSELIFIGGEKVYPAEVENEILKISGVEDCVVTGEANKILGSIIKASVRLSTNETGKEFRLRLHQELEQRVERFKIPQKVELVNSNLFNERFKRSRGSP